jgi:hypothetical protein
LRKRSLDADLPLEDASISDEGLEPAHQLRAAGRGYEVFVDVHAVSGVPDRRDDPQRLVESCVPGASDLRFPRSEGAPRLLEVEP